jgi:hypothetical protein
MHVTLTNLTLPPGLLMLGQSDSPLAQTIIPDLLNYTHDTSHEKIVRALALSLAMMVYAKEEGADTIIEQLSKDRYVSMYMHMYVYICYICTFVFNYT